MALPGGKNISPARRADRNAADIFPRQADLAHDGETDRRTL